MQEALPEDQLGGSFSGMQAGEDASWWRVAMVEMDARGYIGDVVLGHS